MRRHQEDFFALYMLMVHKIAQIDLMAVISGRRACWIAERMKQLKDTLTLHHCALMHGSVRLLANTYAH